MPNNEALKTPVDQSPDDPNEADLDQAIDDLRSVLKESEDTADPTMQADDDQTPGQTASPEIPAMEPDPFTPEQQEPAASAQLPIATGSASSSLNSDVIMDIPVEVQIVLGKTRMKVSSLMKLDEGAIISLDRKIGEPVEIMVNGRMIGRGEITVMEDDETRFGVKLTEVLSSPPAGEN